MFGAHVMASMAAYALLRVSCNDADAIRINMKMFGSVTLAQSGLEYRKWHREMLKRKREAAHHQDPDIAEPDVWSEGELSSGDESEVTTALPSPSSANLSPAYLGVEEDGIDAFELADDTFTSSSEATAEKVGNDFNIETYQANSARDPDMMKLDMFSEQRQDQHDEIQGVVEDMMASYSGSTLVDEGDHLDAITGHLQNYMVGDDPDAHRESSS